MNCLYIFDVRRFGDRRRCNCVSAGCHLAAFLVSFFTKFNVCGHFSTHMLLVAKKGVKSVMLDNMQYSH